jgi:xanthine permease
VAVLLGGCLNSFPYTTFSQNAGLVGMSRVYSRHVVAIAGLLLCLLGLLPRFGALVAALPPAVLGGAGVALFGMVAASGIRMLGEADLGRRENLFVVAVSVGLGLGVSMMPQALTRLPPAVRLICADGIVISTLSAVILNQLVPRPAPASPGPASGLAPEGGRGAGA